MNDVGSEQNGLQPARLAYQRERTLDQVPAYSVGLQLRLAGTEKVYIAVSATELALYFSTDTALHYDLEGRLVKVVDPTQYWRRGLSNRMVHTRKRAAEEGGGLTRAVLTADETAAVIAQAHAAAGAVGEALRAHTVEIEFGKPDVQTALLRVLPVMERVAAFDVAAATRDAERFHAVYGSVAVLPPNEYNALVLQATEGCTHNQCTFCELYRGTRFRTKTVEEFDEHIRAVVAYHGVALRSRRSLFLGEANALTLPAATLLEFFRIFERYFELPEFEREHVPASWWLGSQTRFDGISSFLDVFTGQRRSVDDWINLRRGGLRRVYLGVESGCDALLRWLHKPARAHSVVRVVSALKEANIAVAVILLLGAGGRAFGEAHVRETLDLLKQLPLGRGDTVYLSPLIIYPGGPYDAAALADQIDPLSATEIDEQERAMRAGLAFPAAPHNPYVARYELETFVY